jgi:hypothetical protein
MILNSFIHSFGCWWNDNVGLPQQTLAFNRDGFANGVRTFSCAMMDGLRFFTLTIKILTIPIEKNSTIILNGKRSKAMIGDFRALIVCAIPIWETICRIPLITLIAIRLRWIEELNGNIPRLARSAPNFAITDELLFRVLMLELCHISDL